MKLSEARQITAEIRATGYWANPTEHLFLRDIERGNRFDGCILTGNQAHWLRSIKEKSLNPINHKRKEHDHVH